MMLMLLIDINVSNMHANLNCCENVEKDAHLMEFETISNNK